MKSNSNISQFVLDAIEKHKELSKSLIKEYLEMRKGDNDQDILDVSDLSQEEFNFFKMFLYSASKTCNDGVITEDIDVLHFATMRKVV